MKRVKLVVKAAVLVFAGGICGTASAEIVEGVTMGAADYVNAFNSGNGAKFTLVEFATNAPVSPSWKVLVPSVGGTGSKLHGMTFDYQGKLVNWEGAYPTYRKTGGTAPFTEQNPYKTENNDYYFVTLPLGQQTTTYAVCGNALKCNATAKLNYNPSTGKTKTDYDGGSNITLSVGAAYLYSQYVLGSSSYGTYGNWVPFASSVGWNQLLYADGNSSKGAWSNSDPYLNLLLGVNSDKNYWMSAYDPNKYYTEIGDYSVFVMNLYYDGGAFNGKPMGNMLFLGSMNPVFPPSPPPPAIPEPETYAMLLAGLGLVGAVARRRRTKQ